MNGQTVGQAPDDAPPPAADLLERAAAQKLENATAERFPGTGFHANDRFPARPDKLMAPQHNGYQRYGEFLVAFFGEDDIRFVGDDADYALDAMLRWYDANCRRDVADLSGNGTEMKMVRYIPRLRLADDGGVPVLVLRRDRWNDYLYVLEKMKVGMYNLPLRG